MADLTERAKVFRKAIAEYIEARRDAKSKDRSYDPARYEYRGWLASAAQRVTQLQAVTHVLKATHPDAKGNSLHIAPASLPQHAEVGSHVLGNDHVEDVVGNAAALDVWKLLKVEVEGRRLLEWMQIGDADLALALSDDAGQARLWMQAFAALVRADAEVSTHPMAKQVYWLVADEPQDDASYHLLQPMFASSLAHAVHADIEDARFGEANKAARALFRERTPGDVVYREYHGLAIRKLGGTKPQNISQLNSERRGMNYLLSSLPPPAWRQNARTRMLKRESAFDVLLWFGRVRELVNVLKEFLRANPAPTVETRERRRAIEQAIGEELAMFGVAVRAEQPAGWTRSTDCRLPRCEQLWLDPERAEMPDRKDPNHPEWDDDDARFRSEYQLGQWPDEVATRFGNWLNGSLRDSGLVTVAEPERNYWARQAILDVAWPVPLQRRAFRGEA